MCFKIGSYPVQNTSLTARDIVPQTGSATPDSPVLGTAGDYSGTQKKTGKDTLKIDLDEDTSNKVVF
ncbi:hypothetical protein [Anaeroselena agilis]|uniref:Uncharacterized protein n=1 Tax=Anaeroselena agilis TaxID=3063788 RepID=A0ABU3NV09_9FIRM|nr:hypothetical protein [Selenomonadales bacterium 4137-cl]